MRLLRARNAARVARAVSSSGTSPPLRVASLWGLEVRRSELGAAVGAEGACPPARGPRLRLLTSAPGLRRRILIARSCCVRRFTASRCVRYDIWLYHDTTAALGRRRGADDRAPGAEKLKVALLGASAVGKSSLLQRFVGVAPPAEYEPSASGN